MPQPPSDSPRKPKTDGASAPAKSEGADQPTERFAASRPNNGGTGGTSGSQSTLDDLQGRQIGEFQLLRRLGRGGMAEVYLAEQTTLKRNVAVKVLRGDALGHDDVLIKRFEQEAKAAGSLNHPNIIQVYAIGADAGIHYIAQEYVQGMNLREYLTKRGVPDLPIALHIIRQVSAALEAAGEAGIVHRDIKPENIMIARKGGKVKVGDFGLAQLTQQGERVNLTQVGTTMGTPLYMSPEQVNGSKVDSRSDLYSFGVTCYHLLTGQPPFRGPTAMSIAVKHLKEEAPSLQEARPDLPPALCQIVHRMMAKDPAQRYQTAQAISADLKKLAKVVKEQPEAAADLNLEAPPPSATGRRFRAPQWAVRRPLLALALSSLLASSASAGVGWLMRPKNPLESPVESSSKHGKKENAAAQYFHAKNLFPGDLQAWQAVIDHFPKDRIWCDKAEAEIALLLLKDNRIAEAKTKFNQLKGTPDDDNVKAAAFAGLAIVNFLQSEHRESQKLIAEELTPPLRSKLPADLDQQIRHVTELNRQKLAGKGFDEMFKQTEQNDGEPPR